MNVQVGDIVCQQYGTKLWVVTKLFEGFCTIKILAELDKKFFKKNPISRNVDLLELSHNWFRVPTPLKPKFKIGEKVFFDRHPGLQQTGMIVSWLPELIQNQNMTIKNSYHILYETISNHQPASILLPEKQILKIINTNLIWNNICSK